MTPAISAARSDARASDPAPPAPPSAPERDGPALALMGALPLLAGTGSLALVAGRGGRMLPLLGVTLLTAAVLVGAQIGRSRAARRRRLERLRGDYRAALEEWRTARDDGAGCEPAMADGSLSVVVGTELEGEHPARPAVPPDVDPGCLHALERALRLPGRRLPRLADLRTTERLVTSGAGARGRARAIVVDAARRHPPDRLRIAVLAGDDAAREAWRWTAWLPHACAASPGAAEGVAALPRDLHLLLVVEAAEDAAEVLRAAGPSTTVLLIDPAGPAPQVDGPFLDRATAERAARIHARVGRCSHRERQRDPRPQGRPRLEVMLGLDPAGSPVKLDLREAADGGQGPHGLLVGATGSGKSALLRSLVLDLAASHPPERLALGLIDFKGGAALADLAGLPHVAGLATNLAGDLALVDRLASALTTEVAERQQRLSDAGGLPSLGAWTPETALMHGPPPPRLLLVVDELGELLVARPDLLDVLTALGRVGRSLGIHLLVSTQRWEEGRLHGLEAHLSYRIALRTFSEIESRAVLGLPDAARLPRAPGHGLLRADGVVRPFRSLDLTRPQPAPTRTARSRPLGATPSDADHLVAWEQRLRAAAATHPRSNDPIWTAELAGPLTLLDLLDPDAPTERPDDPDDDPSGIVAVGVRERPRGRRHERLEIDLDRGRHLLVVGGPGSGVSTALRSIAWAHVLHRAPRSLQVVLVDLAGRGLDPLRDLPHVTLCARADEPEALDELAARLREELRAGDGADERPDLLVVIDGWARLDALPPPVGEVLRSLPTADPARGLRCAVGAARWSDLRPAVRDRLRLLAELRLGDPGESGVDRRRAGDVPRDRPGRGLDLEGHDVLLACPGSTADEARMARSVRDAWPDHLETPTPSRSAVAPGRQRVAARADLPGAALLLGVAATPAGPEPVRLQAPLLVRGDPPARAAFLDLLIRRAVDRGTAWRVLRVGGAAAVPVPAELCVPWLDADEQDPAAGEARIAEIVRHLETRPTGPEDGGGPPAHPRLLVLADVPTPALLHSLLRLRSPGAAAWATLVVAGGADRTRPAPGWWTLDLGSLATLGALGPEARLHRPAHPAVTIGTGAGTDVDGAGLDLRRGCASPGRSP